MFLFAKQVAKLTNVSYPNCLSSFLIYTGGDLSISVFVETDI